MKRPLLATFILLAVSLPLISEQNTLIPPKAKVYVAAENGDKDYLPEAFAEEKTPVVAVHSRDDADFEIQYAYQNRHSGLVWISKGGFLVTNLGTHELAFADVIEKDAYKAEKAQKSLTGTFAHHLKDKIEKQKVATGTPKERVLAVIESRQAAPRQTGPQFYASVDVLDTQVVSQVYEEDPISYGARTGAAAFSCSSSNNKDVASCLEAKSPKKTFAGTATLVSLRTKLLNENYEMALKIYGSPMITIGKPSTVQIDAKGQLYVLRDDGKAWKADVLRKELVNAQQTEVRASANAPLPRTELSLVELEGSMIVAGDGQGLGLITTNCFDPNALCNAFGDYGNKFNAKSMLNDFGAYGNPFSERSPFNTFTSTPPRILKNGKTLAYLTVNTALSPRVDPYWLIGILKIGR